MSLETLLEAAEFIDCERDKNGRTRVKHADNFHPYAKTESPPNELNKSPKAGGSNPRKSRQRHQSSTSTCSTEDESSASPSNRGAYSSITSLGNRDLHNRLEKNRRAQLKVCFEQLKAVIPAFEDDRKASNLMILRSSTRHIQGLRRQEMELEMEMQKLARQKIMQQERIVVLKQELMALNIDIDLSCFVKTEMDDDAHSTASTATADNDDPIMSDDDGQSSSTLSTTSTPSATPSSSGNTSSGFKVPTPGSPQKSPRSSLTAPVTMHSILNRTLLGASTSVLTSLTSTLTTAVRPLSADTRVLPPLSKAPPSKKTASVNQLLHLQLQRRIQQAAALQKSVTQSNIKIEGGDTGPGFTSVMQLQGAGTVITYGPATVTKLVPETQANCDITSGVQLSSLTKEYLEMPAANTTPVKSTPSITAAPTTSNWSNPPSIIDGQSRPTLQLNRLLPSLFNTTPLQTNGNFAAANSKPKATQSVAVTTVTLPVTATGGLAAAFQHQQQNSIINFQQPSTVTMDLVRAAASMQQPRQATTVASNVTGVASHQGQQLMQAQLITPAQLQQLLLQSPSFAQQLFSGTTTTASSQPQMIIGQAPSQQMVIGQASSQQMVIGQASSQPQMIIGQASSPQMVIGQASPQMVLGQVSSPQMVVRQASSPQLLKKELTNVPATQFQRIAILPNMGTNVLASSPTVTNHSAASQVLANAIQLAGIGANKTQNQVRHILAGGGNSNLPTVSNVNQINLSTLPIASVSNSASTFSNVNTLNLSGLPIAQFIQPLTMVSPSVHHTGQAGQLGTVVSPQVLKSLGLGHIPVIQPSAFPMKPLVMVTMPNVVVATQPSVISSTNILQHTDSSNK